MGTSIIASLNVVRLAFLLAGWLALGIGVLGLVLPLLPGVPFFIVAAWCFSRGSERVHGWLMSHRIIGPLIRNWHEHQVIPLPAKIGATIGLVTSVMFLVIFAPQNVALANEVWLMPVVEAGWPIPTIAGMINAAIGAFILSRPSRIPDVKS